MYLNMFYVKVTGKYSVLIRSGVDPGGGAKGATPPTIKKFRGESVFSPLKVLAFL